MPERGSSIRLYIRSRANLISIAPPSFLFLILLFWQSYRFVLAPSQPVQLLIDSRKTYHGLHVLDNRLAVDWHARWDCCRTRSSRCPCSHRFRKASSVLSNSGKENASGRALDDCSSLFDCGPGSREHWRIRPAFLLDSPALTSNRSPCST